MRNQLLLILIVVLLGAAASVYLRHHYWAPGQQPTPQSLTANQQPTSQSVTEKAVTPDTYITRLANTYRLKPDQRFLEAVANIHHFLTAAGRTQVTTEFADHHWQVTYQGASVGQLPEYPDFPELLGMLVTWAQQLAKDQHFTLTATPLATADQEYLEVQLEQFAVSSVATAANHLNRLWATGTHTTALFPYATQALTLLVLQQQDELEAAEQVSTQALALLALTKAFTTQAMTREEALLAYLSGYSTHARTLATNLAANDAIRLYVRHEGDALKSIAASSPANNQAWYLYLLWLARNEEFDHWKESIQQHLITENEMLPILKTGLILNEFGLNPRISGILPYITLISLANEVSKEEATKSIVTLLSQYLLSETEIDQLQKEIIAWLFKLANFSTVVTFFETQIDSLTSQYAGPFLDGDTYAAYFRSYFYSGLYRLGIHLLKSLSSSQATTQYAEFLGDSTQPLAATFQRWYRNLATAKAGQGDPQRLLQDLAELKEFGAPPFFWTLKQRKNYLTLGSPEFIAGVQALLPHLDTRSSHQRELLSLAHDALLDLPLTETLGENIARIDSANFQETQVWLAEFREDLESLTTLLARSDLFPAVRLQALTVLAKLNPASTASLEQEYQTTLKRVPDDWEVVKQYLDLLLKTSQFKKAREVGHQWLQDNENHPSLKPIVIQVKIARSYLQEGLLEEAWQTIQPQIASYKADAMETALDILVARSQLEEADKIAQALYQRYPDGVSSLIQIAKFYWGQGQYQQAATVLAKGPALNNSADWRFKIGAGFLEVFANRSDAESLTAYRQLLEQGIKHEYLLSFAMAVAHQAKRFQLAEQMLQLLKYPGLGQLMLFVKRYAYRKEFDGPERALAWLSTQIPPSIRPPVSMLAYEDEQYELLWEFIGDPPADEHGEFIWLMRASGYLKEKLKSQAQNNAHQQQLQHYYEQHTVGYYPLIGRYLLGKTSEAEVLSLLTNPKTECEIAYYMGLRAQVEGRYQDASAWYRRAMETGLTKNGEYLWAFQQLYIWHNLGKSLSRITVAGSDAM